jgi:hypothetical protein
MRNIAKTILRLQVMAGWLVVAGSAAAAPPDDPAHGEIYQNEATVEVWSAPTSQWVTPEVFWLDYAAQGEGKFWGRSSEYPAYKDVSEHDTLLVEVQGGPCLMYFFHNRWRRAQDVKRWDPVFNDILGCPNVFE